MTVDVAPVLLSKIQRTIRADGLLYPRQQAAIVPKISAPVKKRCTCSAAPASAPASCSSSSRTRTSPAPPRKAARPLQSGRSDVRDDVEGDRARGTAEGRARCESGAGRRQRAAVGLRQPAAPLSRGRHRAEGRQRRAGRARARRARSRRPRASASTTCERSRTSRRSRPLPRSATPPAAATSRRRRSLLLAHHQPDRRRRHRPAVLSWRDRPGRRGRRHGHGHLARDRADARVAGGCAARSPSATTPTSSAPNGVPIPRRSRRSVRRSTPANTTVEVWVEADNKDGKLRPGSSMRVEIVAKTVPNALVIPQSGGDDRARRARRSRS